MPFTTTLAPITVEPSVASVIDFKFIESELLKEVKGSFHDITNGSYLATIREFETVPCSPEMEPLMSRLKKMADQFEASTNAVKEAQDQELLDFTARRLMEMAADIIMCHLLIQDASKAADLFSKSAHVYLNFAEAEVTKHTNFIKNMDKEDLAFYKK